MAAIDAIAALAAMWLAGACLYRGLLAGDERWMLWAAATLVFADYAVLFIDRLFGA